MPLLVLCVGVAETNSGTSRSAQWPDNRTAHSWLTGEMKGFGLIPVSASRPETKKVMPFLDGHHSGVTATYREEQFLG